MERTDLDPRDIERFLRTVDQSDGCWEWPLAKDKDGYGWFKMKRKIYYAHRIAYLIGYGHLDDDLCVCHSCDNPPCVNPSDLWQGTVADNNHDKALKGHVAKAANPRAKVTDLQMDEIKRRFNAGEPVSDLAKEFGYSRCHLYKPLRGDQWS